MAEPDLDSMSVDELDNLMRHPEQLATLDAELADEAVADQPETAPVEPTPAPAEPEKAEPVAEPEVSELDVLRAKIDEALATAKKNESIAGRATAESGYLKGQIARLQTELRGRGVESTDFEPPPEPVRNEPSRDTSGYLGKVAVDRAARLFMGEHPALPQEAVSDAGKYANEYFRAEPDDTPEDIELRMRALLREGLYDHQARQSAKMASDREVRRADQMRALTTAKAKATISGSGSPPPPISKPKTLDEMSAAELDAELRRMTQGQPPPSRRI